MNYRRLLLAVLSVLLPAFAFAVPQRALVNLSAQGTAGAAGPAALSSSFTIEGTAAKTVLIRAVGPTLGVTGFIADPALVVYNGFGQRVAENDNWGSAANSAAIASATSNVGAFPLIDGSKDAALLLTLNPGTYTARIDGVSGSSGVAQLDVYDADTVTLTPRLANLTLNTRIATVGDTAVVGFVIGSGPSQNVLIRGLALTLANPAINVLNSSNASVATNDNWGTAATNADLANAATTAGLRPLANGGNDAALLATLVPGAYTIQLTGVSGSTGNATVEIAVIDADRTDFAPALLGPVLPTAGSPPFGFTLSSVAIGRPVPAYQWSKNGTAA